MSRLLLNATGPEHATTAYPNLPFPDEGEGAGGAGGDGTDDEGDDDKSGDGDDDKSGDDKDWRAEARKWEARAKADARKATTAAAEAERLRKAGLTDSEKALDAARAEGEKNGLAKSATALVTAHLEAALGHLDDEQRDALVDGVNAARFLGDDGLPDKDAIKTWAAKVAPKGKDQQGFSSLPQGRRQPAKTTDMNALIRRAAGV